MSDSEDDWETADVPEGQFTKVDMEAVRAAEAAAAAEEAIRREREAEAAAAASLKASREQAQREASDAKPMILVDLTILSDGAVHNRFDKFGVNDPEAKSSLLRRIEADYVTYANDAALIAAGTVRPCSQGVYRAALATLRDEVEGHFFAAVFPPP